MEASKVVHHHDKGHPDVHGQELRAQNEVAVHGLALDEPVQASRHPQPSHQAQAHPEVTC